ncbi:MAG: hypothetical protein R3292_05740 [Alcanivorax sp.]|nr:hypothetical protein [Alcanivorax sp.]
MRKRLLGGLVALVLLPLQGQAAISNAQIEDLELHLWQIRSDFHMYTIMTGNKNYQGDLSKSISGAKQALDDMADSAASDKEKKLISTIKPKWATLRKAAEANTVVSKGYTDAYIIQDVNEMPAEVSDAIKDAGIGEAGKYDDIRQLATYLQHMTSEYLNVAADPAGGMAAGTNEGRMAFKDAVPEFEKRLAAAQKAYAKDDAMVRSLNQVAVKWRFIRQSMVKFYENAVPFLIYRYTNQMVDTMEQAIQLTATDVQKPNFGPVK